ncbi:MAG: hypothetical protein JNM80_05640, partial [Phycisphaerae bacterium]|nr:hypothetical protein [Phycisphaerae bacterium]
MILAPHACALLGTVAESVSRRNELRDYLDSERQQELIEEARRCEESRRPNRDPIRRTLEWGRLRPILDFWDVVLARRGLDTPAPTPTVSVSPDLLDLLQRAAAAVDPGA